MCLIELVPQVVHLCKETILILLILVNPILELVVLVKDLTWSRAWHEPFLKGMLLKAQFSLRLSQLNVILDLHLLQFLDVT